MARSKCTPGLSFPSWRFAPRTGKTSLRKFPQLLSQRDTAEILISKPPSVVIYYSLSVLFLLCNGSNKSRGSKGGLDTKQTSIIGSDERHI